MGIHRNPADYFGDNVFTEQVMRERVSPEVFEEVRRMRETGVDMSMAAADVVAAAMKDWAVERGATHFTHWFQPLNGFTAEKHDSFVTNPKHGRMMLEFSGKELVRGEPDASSFPSGGLRATFEARGYTAWDCTSPAFLKEDSTGVVLCIPTCFCSYTGESLDKKTPLLRSIDALSREAVRIVRLFGDTACTKVRPAVGPEQEYFLVDHDKYRQRLDLVFTGRTLFGAPAPKGQELDDQYFGVIRPRVGAFMRDLNEELWKLGITARTQHNEVAPAQHELATIYTDCNIATDHNQLVMETMKKVALRHNLNCLLHEKPYACVNGSGKHDNWSLTTDTGKNLMDPGDTPHENIQFLLVLSCILAAVDRHADLLRWSAACVGNDDRLGADEAPPAIVSVFLGDQLDDVVSQLVDTGEATHSLEGVPLHTGVKTVPEFMKDATDRNRTSPFAFTGNKFEFRMVGSSDSVASANTILNAITAEAFCEAADILEASADFDMAVHDLIKKNFSEHRRVIFNGNGYSPEWVKEAARRGLPNIPTMVDAVSALTTPKAVSLFERFGIFTEAELTSREEIMYETYVKTMQIEASTMITMADRQILPAVFGYAEKLGRSVAAVESTGLKANPASVQRRRLDQVSKLLSQLETALELLKTVSDRAKTLTSDYQTCAFYVKDIVVPAMKAVREPADELEQIVDASMWPFPTYGDLMFDDV